MTLCTLIARIVLSILIIGFLPTIIIGEMLTRVDNIFVDILFILIGGSWIISFALTILGFIIAIVCTIWGVPIPFDWR